MNKSLLIIASMVTAAAALAGPTMEREGLLADDKGMTLYTFKKDTPLQSTCYDACAKNWPPFVADAAAKAQGDLAIIERTDGSKQWAYKGQPLYYYAGDAKPDDATGDGLKEVWSVVRTGAAASKASDAATGSAY